MHRIVDQKGLIAVLNRAVDRLVSLSAQIKKIHPQAAALLDTEEDLDAQLTRLIGEPQVTLGSERRALDAFRRIEAAESIDLAPEKAATQSEVIGDRARDRQRRRPIVIGMSRDSYREHYRT